MSCLVILFFRFSVVPFFPPVLFSKFRVFVQAPFTYLLGTAMNSLLVIKGAKGGSTPPKKNLNGPRDQIAEVPNRSMIYGLLAYWPIALRTSRKER